jgi:hypothetical protein
LLGAVHGDIGAFEQRFCIAAVLWIEGNACAYRYLQTVPRQFKGLLEGTVNFLRDQQRILCCSDGG